MIGLFSKTRIARSSVQSSDQYTLMRLSIFEPSRMVPWDATLSGIRPGAEAESVLT